MAPLLARGRASLCDGARAQQGPLLGPGTVVGIQVPRGVDSFQASLETNGVELPNCPFLGPRKCLANWQVLGADKVLLEGIKKGVSAPLHQVPKTNCPRATPNPQEVEKALADYLQTGAIKKLCPRKVERTKYWVPIFPRPKKDSEKVRVITDLRALNQCHQVRDTKQKLGKLSSRLSRTIP